MHQWQLRMREQGGSDPEARGFSSTTCLLQKRDAYRAGSVALHPALKGRFGAEAQSVTGTVTTIHLVI